METIPSVSLNGNISGFSTPTWNISRSNATVNNNNSTTNCSCRESSVLCNATAAVVEEIKLDSNPFSGTAGLIFMSCALTLSVIICVENILTIIILRDTPALRTIQNKYIVSLAFADYLVGLAFIELFFVKQFDWDCQLTIAVLHSSIVISMFNLLAIAVDRYVFIAKPFLHIRRFTDRFTNTVIVVQWVMGLFYGFFPTFFFSLGKGKGCHPFFILHHDLTTWGHLAHYTLNILVTGVLYGLIARIAKQKTDQRMRANRFVTKTLQPHYDATENMVGNFQGSKGCGKFFKCCRKRGSPGTIENSKANTDDSSSSEVSCKVGMNSLCNKHKVQSFVIGPESIYQKRKDNTADGTESITSHDDPANQEEVRNDTSVTTGQPDAGSFQCLCRRRDPKIEEDNEQPHIQIQKHETPSSNKNINIIIDGKNENINMTPNLNDGIDKLTSVLPDASHPKSCREDIHNDQSPQSSTPSINTTTPATATTTATLPLPSSSRTCHSLRWLKQVILVYGLFVICWTPSQISALLYLLGLTGQDPIYVVSWLGIINSALNFYIYGYTNPQFRKALRQRIKQKRFVAQCCCFLLFCRIHKVKYDR